MNKMLKTFIIYISITLFAILFTNVYAVFGHGVRSKHMDFMFIVPLVSALIFLCMFFFRICIYENKKYRLFLNIYSSGAASLTIGLLLRGVIYIAGSSSVYVSWFIYAGTAMLAFGILMLFILLISAKIKMKDK